MTDPLNWDAFAQAVNAAQSIAIVSHLKPDGDAVGSVLAMMGVVRLLNKRPEPYIDQGVPEYLRFIPYSATIKSFANTGKWDLALIVDCSDEDRTGEAGKYVRANSTQVINIDHHPTNTNFGTLNLIDPSAVSTTEILFHGFQHLGWEINSQTAHALMVGLVTDTLGFRVNSVTARTMQTAASLITLGAPMYEIIQKTLNTTAFKTVNVWKHALQTVELDRQVIHASITLESLKQIHATHAGDTGGLVGFLISTVEAKIAVVFKEIEGAKVELSMRCKPGCDVAQVAFALGGGGHQLAAGATVAGTLEEVKAQVLPLLHQAASAFVALT
jgi:bifunctional oligoribonuclease and PAP phosphatase NrnA